MKNRERGELPELDKDYETQVFLNGTGSRLNGERLNAFPLKLD